MWPCDATRSSARASDIQRNDAFDRKLEDELPKAAVLGDGEKNILIERDLCKARRNPGAGRTRKADWQGREAQLTALNTDWGWIPYSFAN